MAKFRWTRRRFYKAKHLSRLLGHFYGNTPPLVDRYHELLNDHWHVIGQRDPLSEPLKYRLERSKDDGIPF